MKEEKGSASRRAPSNYIIRKLQLVQTPSQSGKMHEQSFWGNKMSKGCIGSKRWIPFRSRDIDSSTNVSKVLWTNACGKRHMSDRQKLLGGYSCDIFWYRPHNANLIKPRYRHAITCYNMPKFEFGSVLSSKRQSQAKEPSHLLSWEQVREYSERRWNPIRNKKPCLHKYCKTASMGEGLWWANLTWPGWRVVNLQDLALVQAAHLRISLKHDRRAHERLVCNLHISLAKKHRVLHYWLGYFWYCTVLLSVDICRQKKPRLQHVLPNVVAKHSLYIYSRTTVEKHLLHLLLGRIVFLVLNPKSVHVHLFSFARDRNLVSGPKELTVPTTVTTKPYNCVK